MNDHVADNRGEGLRFPISSSSGFSSPIALAEELISYRFFCYKATCSENYRFFCFEMDARKNARLSSKRTFTSFLQRKTFRNI